jgi:phage terminase small subunit
MPTKKPSGLIERHETAAETAARVAHEDALRPRHALRVSPPARLKRHPTAAEVWRRLMRMYNELEAEIVTGLDQDILIDYCILAEQVGELDQMRKAAFENWDAMKRALESLPQDTPIKEEINMILKTNETFDYIVKLDSRADRKRTLLFQLRQSLYLTPRARAGAIPAQKPPEEPKDELESLLDEFVSAAHGKVE